MKMSAQSVSPMQALRQITMSQLWTSPFRHNESQSVKKQLVHARILAQVQFDYNEDVDDKGEIDDEICNKDLMKLINMKAQSDKLENILCDTILGKGNATVLLSGRSGFGKSALLSSVIHNIRKNRGDDSFVYIYLNGKMLSNDATALFEIVSQLSQQNGRCHLNMNMFSEAESDDEQKAEKKKFKKSDFVSQTEYLAGELAKVTTTDDDIQKKSIIIVLDNFKMFTQRPKQALLYHLFELQQSIPSALAIVCITQEKSVYHLLEKRVRSRFNCKKIHVPDERFFADYDLMHQIMYNAMTIHTYNALTIEDSTDAAMAQNRRIRALLQRYNAWIQNILANKTVNSFLRELHFLGYPPSKFLIIAGLLSAMLFDKKHFLCELSTPTVNDMICDIKRELFDSPFLHMMRSMTVNELMVLAAAARLHLVHGQFNLVHGQFNFEVIILALQNLSNSGNHLFPEIHTRKLLLSFRRLLTLKFFVGVSQANNSRTGHTPSSIWKSCQVNFDMVRFNKDADVQDIFSFIAKKQGLPVWFKVITNNSIPLF